MSKRIEVKVTSNESIDICIENDNSFNLQELQNALSAFLKLDSDNRQYAIAVLSGMFMAQEVSKGNPIDFSSLEILK